MRLANWLIICIIGISLSMMACSTTEEKHETHHVSVDQTTGPTGQTQLPDTSEPDWAKKTVTVQGKSAVNPNFASNPGQQKLMAGRGAEIEAKRQLLEQVLGVKLDEKTFVKDMVAESDRINAESSGLIREAKKVGEFFDGSIYTVNMELKLYTVYTYLKTQKIYYK